MLQHASFVEKKFHMAIMSKLIVIIGETFLKCNFSDHRAYIYPSSYSLLAAMTSHSRFHFVGTFIALQHMFLATDVLCLGCYSNCDFS